MLVDDQQPQKHSALRDRNKDGESEGTDSNSLTALTTDTTDTANVTRGMWHVIRDTPSSIGFSQPRSQALHGPWPMAHGSRPTARQIACLRSRELL